MSSQKWNDRQCFETKEISDWIHCFCLNHSTCVRQAVAPSWGRCKCVSLYGIIVRIYKACPFLLASYILFLLFILIILYTKVPTYLVHSSWTTVDKRLPKDPLESNNRPQPQADHIQHGELLDPRLSSPSKYARIFSAFIAMSLTQLPQPSRNQMLFLFTCLPIDKFRGELNNFPRSDRHIDYLKKFQNACSNSNFITFHRNSYILFRKNVHAWALLFSTFSSLFSWIS